MNRKMFTPNLVRGLHLFLIAALLGLWPTPVTAAPIVLGAATTTTLTSSLNPSTFSQTVTFTATVTSGGGIPTGTVTFKDSAAEIGTGTLNDSGVATFSTSTLDVGIHVITGEYGGDGSFNGSTSAPLTQVVEEAPDPIELILSTVEDIEAKLDPGGVVEGWINSARDTVIGVVSSARDAILAKLGDIQGQLTSIEEAESSIVDLLTNPAFGLEEIKREVSEIEEKLHKLDVKIIVAKRYWVIFILTSFGGSRVDADVKAVELSDRALVPSDFSVIRVSTGLLKLTLDRKAIRAGGSHPLLVEMEATDDPMLSGVDIAVIQSRGDD